MADERNGGDPYDIADAILAALPDMITADERAVDRVARSLWRIKCERFGFDDALDDAEEHLKGHWRQNAKDAIAAVLDQLDMGAV